ncbi:hypothetical protein [Methylosinus trichosporium]|uniref:hypothetical protein n=1 Tax=Methylosinus trichosporium TaxID=426 RepID=UPI001FCF060F|nr:hypothetical protein [Methylosinus trichosporium]
MNSLTGNAGRLLRLLDNASADDPALQHLRKVVRRSAHVLRRDRRQLVAQLELRAHPEKLANIAAGLLEPERLAPGLRFAPTRRSEDDGSSGLIMIIEGHEGPVRGAHYLSDVDGKPRVLSWSDDHTIRWWDAITGEPLGATMCHDGGVKDAQFLSGIGGRPSVISWDEANFIRWWDALTGQPIGATIRCEQAFIGAQFLADVDGPPAC